MGKKQYLTAPPQTDKMPKSVPNILINEGAERFAFYGSRCILVFYMTTYLLNAAGDKAPMSEEKAKVWFHLFVSAVYFMPLVGALISDIWLGKFKTIVIFSAVYFVGLMMLVVDRTILGLSSGLIMIAIGSGMIKPCVSANIGDQFSSTNRHLMTKVYIWFYWSINFGSVISTILIPEVLDRTKSPAISFGIPAGLMFVATMAYWLGRWKFIHIPKAGLNFVKECFSGEGLKAIVRLSVIFVFIAPFWALFDQMDSAWMLTAKKLNLHWMFHRWKPTQVAAANPFLILVLIPVFSYVIYPAINKFFKLNPIRKIGIGLFVAASPFVVTALIEAKLSTGAVVSVAWLFLAYVFLTSAEVMVSITALEFSYTQAPKKMKSFIMAVFLLSISLGNTFTAIVNQQIMIPGRQYTCSGTVTGQAFTGTISKDPNEYTVIAVRDPNSADVVIPNGTWNVQMNFKDQDIDSVLTVSTSQSGDVKAEWTDDTFKSEVADLNYDNGQLSFTITENDTSKLSPPNYYWFFVIVMLVTAVLYVPIARLYKPKEYIQDGTEEK